MSDPNVTRVLRAEHRVILRVADAFERLLESAAPAPPPSAVVADFVVFFRLFTDACHHGKEEDVLFAALEQDDVAEARGHIALMREEHVEGRVLVRRIAEALQRVEAGAERAAELLRDAGAAYVDFIRAHIRKEDDGVFAIADDTLRGPACAAVCAAYESTCSGRFEGKSLAELEALAERLVQFR